MVNRRNKKGWIKIVEAFAALAILMMFLFFIVGSQKSDVEKESFLDSHNKALLTEIAKNSTLRGEVFSESLPANSTEDTFSIVLKNYLTENKVGNTTCIIQICEIGCDFIDLNLNKEVYSTKRIFYSTTTDYSPREMRLSCYEN